MLRQRNESPIKIDARMHRTSKTLGCEMNNELESLCDRFRSASSRRFDHESPQNNQTNIDATIYGVLISLTHYALPQMRVA